MGVREVLQPDLPLSYEAFVLVRDVYPPDLLATPTMHRPGHCGQLTLGDRPVEVGLVAHAHHPAVLGAFAIPERGTDAGRRLDGRAVHTAVHDAERLGNLGSHGPAHHDLVAGRRAEPYPEMAVEPGHGRRQRGQIEVGHPSNLGHAERGDSASVTKGMLK